MSFAEPNLCVFVAKALQDSGKAILCEIEGKAVWLPKSQLHDESDELAVGEEGTIYIPAWLAKDKELV